VNATLRSTRIVVADDFPSVFTGSEAHEYLSTLGDVRTFTERGAHDQDELVRRVGDAEVALNVRAHAHYTAEILRQCAQLRMISIWGTGTDNVDLAACRARGVTVTNTPGVNAHAVAEHALALMLAVTRRLPAMDRAVRGGEWPRALLVQLEGKTLGVVGLGAIGSRLARIAAPLGVRVLGYSARNRGQRSADGVQIVPLETLLRESDIISLHLRLAPDTRGLLNAERLALLKPSSYLINTARAALVDRNALTAALQGRRIAGAALDVFYEEPLAPGDPLLSLPNVVLTPHNAGITQEVIDGGLRRSVENIELFLRGTPRDVVV
jgi:phosphoglycerate dehydrogenase-like enzyme